MICQSIVLKSGGERPSSPGLGVDDFVDGRRRSCCCHSPATMMPRRSSSIATSFAERPERRDAALYLLSLIVSRCFSPML